MRVRIDGVVFEAPAGLEDSTSYVYRSQAPYEELTVELELPPGGATPAAEVVADVRGSLAGFYQGKVLFEAEGPTTLAGEPASFLRYQLRGDEQVFAKLVVGNPGGAGSDYVKLSWASSSDHGGVDARVDAIVASFAAAELERDTAARVPGYERVQAGPWALDVPASLGEPRTFIYEDPEAELRVELTVHEAGAPEPSFAAREAARLAEGGTLEERQAESRGDQGERVILRISSPRDPNGESTVILAKRELELAGERAGERRWIELTAAGPSSEGPRLQTVVDELLASVHAQEDGP